MTTYHLKCFSTSEAGKVCEQLVYRGAAFAWTGSSSNHPCVGEFAVYLGETGFIRFQRWLESQRIRLDLVDKCEPINLPNVVQP